MEQETRAEVADLAAAEEYKKIERTYKTGIGLLLVNIPIYFVHAGYGEIQPNLQSVMSNFGLIALHFMVTSGVYLRLGNRLNSRLQVLYEEKVASNLLKIDQPSI